MKSIEPLVTIAIPVYKIEFLVECIESIILQTYKNIEIIIVNDCSPHDVRSIIDRFNDSRIFYYENETNIGAKDPSYNWNKCLSYAKGDFFSLLCDDDTYEPMFVEKMLKLAIRFPQVNVFRSRVRMVDSRNNVIDLYPSSPEWESMSDYMWSAINGYRKQTISEFLFRTFHVRNKGGYVHMPMAWCSDWLSIFSFSQEGGIAHTNDFLVNFRMSEINISVGNSRNIREKIEAHILFSKEINNLLIYEHPLLKKLIRNARELSFYREISTYLSYATIKDFFYLLFHRKDKEYNLSLKFFIKAIYLRLTYLFS